MRRERKVTVLPKPYPPLARMTCCQCGKVGVTLIAMWRDAQGVPREALYCDVDCARPAGWPWLRATGRAA